MERQKAEPYVASGTLAEAPLAGGEAPRERLHGVQWADWSPDGKRLAIVRDVGGRNRLESPVGTVLYETAGWLGHPRFSPKGDAIALLDHWARLGDMGSVVLVSLAGKATKLSEGYISLQGLAWRPDGKEIWFTGTKVGGNRSLWAVDRSGRLRLVFRQTGSLRLEDISRAGDVLLRRGGDSRRDHRPLTGAGEGARPLVARLLGSSRLLAATERRSSSTSPARQAAKRAPSF